MEKMFEDLKEGLTEVDTYLSGKSTGYKATVPAEIDVKSIRKGLHMTQAGFSDTFGFSLDAIKHWEGGRRTPEAPARAFLTVISRNPKAVIAALKPRSVTKVAYAMRKGKLSSKLAAGRSRLNTAASFPPTRPTAGPTPAHTAPPPRDRAKPARSPRSSPRRKK
jgi:putative transcriptional regulator